MWKFYSNVKSESHVSSVFYDVFTWNILRSCDDVSHVDSCYNCPIDSKCITLQHVNFSTSQNSVYTFYEGLCHSILVFGCLCGEEFVRSTQPEMHKKPRHI